MVLLKTLFFNTKSHRPTHLFTFGIFKVNKKKPCKIQNDHKDLPVVTMTRHFQAAHLDVQTEKTFSKMLKILIYLK